jgi:hypothetical protein
MLRIGIDSINNFWVLDTISEYHCNVKILEEIYKFLLTLDPSDILSSKPGYPSFMSCVGIDYFNYKNFIFKKILKN